MFPKLLGLVGWPLLILIIALQARTLRALQYYPAPELPAERTMLNEMLQVGVGSILAGAGALQHRTLQLYLCALHAPFPTGHYR